MPFMAIDVLLYNIEHTVIYDAESLLYVLIWITFMYSGPNESERKMTKEFFDKSVLRKWSPLKLGEEIGLEDVAARKKFTMMIYNEFVRNILRKRDPFFSPLDGCLVSLRCILFPPEPLLPLGPEGDVTMSYRVKAHVLDGMKRVLKETKESLAETDENSASQVGNQPSPGDDGQIVCTNMEDIKDGRPRQLVEDLGEKKEKIDPIDEELVNYEQNTCGESEAEGADEAGFCEGSRPSEKNSGTDVEEKHLINGQTPIGTPENLISRSSTGKRYAEAALEPVPSTRSHKRARTANSPTLNGSGSD